MADTNILRLIFNAIATLVKSIFDSIVMVYDVISTVFSSLVAIAKGIDKVLKIFGLNIMQPVVQILEAIQAVFNLFKDIFSFFAKHYDLTTYLLLIGPHVLLTMIMFISPLASLFPIPMLLAWAITPFIPGVLLVYNIFVVSMDLASAISETKATVFDFFAWLWDNIDVLGYILLVIAVLSATYIPQITNIITSILPSYAVVNLMIFTIALLGLPVVMMIYFFTRGNSFMSALNQTRFTIRTWIRNIQREIQKLIYGDGSINYNSDLTNMELLFFGQLFGENNRQFLTDPTIISPLSNKGFDLMTIENLNEEFFKDRNYQKSLYAKYFADYVGLDQTQPSSNQPKMTRMDYIALPYNNIQNADAIKNKLTATILMLLDQDPKIGLNEIPDKGTYDFFAKTYTPLGPKDFANGSAPCKLNNKYSMIYLDPTKRFSQFITPNSIPIPTITFTGSGGVDSSLNVTLNLSTHTNLPLDTQTNIEQSFRNLKQIESDIKKLEAMIKELRTLLKYKGPGDPLADKLAKWDQILDIMNQGYNFTTSTPAITHPDLILILNGTAPKTYKSSDSEISVKTLGLSQVRKEIWDANRKMIFDVMDKLKKNLMSIPSGYTDSLARLDKYIQAYGADPAFNGVNTKFNLDKAGLMGYTYSFTGGAKQIMIMSDYNPIAVLPKTYSGALSSASLNVDSLYDVTIATLSKSSDPSSVANLFAMTDVVFELVSNNIPLRDVANIYHNDRASNVSLLFDLENNDANPLYAISKSTDTQLKSLQSEFTAISQSDTAIQVLIKTTVNKSNIERAIQAAPTRAGEYPEFTGEVGGRYIKRTFYDAAAIMSDVYKDLSQIVMQNVFKNTAKNKYVYSANDPIDLVWMRYDMQNWDDTHNFLKEYNTIDLQFHQNGIRDVLNGLDAKVGQTNIGAIQVNPGIKQKLLDVIDYVSGYSGLIYSAVSSGTIGPISAQVKNMIINQLSPKYFKLNDGASEASMCLMSLLPVDYVHFHVNVPLNIQKFDLNTSKTIGQKLSRISDIGDLGLFLQQFTVSEDYKKQRHNIANAFIIKTMLDLIWWPQFCSEYMYDKQCPQMRDGTGVVRSVGFNRWSNQINRTYLTGYKMPTPGLLGRDATHSNPNVSGAYMRQYNSPVNCLGWGLINIGMHGIFSDFSTGFFNTQYVGIKNEVQNLYKIDANMYDTIYQNYVDVNAANGNSFDDREYTIGLIGSLTGKIAPTTGSGYSNLASVIQNTGGNNPDLFKAICRAYRHDAMIAYCFYMATVFKSVPNYFDALNGENTYRIEWGRKDIYNDIYLKNISIGATAENYAMHRSLYEKLLWGNLDLTDIGHELIWLLNSAESVSTNNSYGYVPKNYISTDGLRMPTYGTSSIAYTALPASWDWLVNRTSIGTNDGTWLVADKFSPTTESRASRRLDFIKDPLSWFNRNRSYEIYPLSYTTGLNQHWFDGNTSGVIRPLNGALVAPVAVTTSTNVAGWVRAFAQCITNTGWKA